MTGLRDEFMPPARPRISDVEIGAVDCALRSGRVVHVPESYAFASDVRALVENLLRNVRRRRPFQTGRFSMATNEHVLSRGAK